MIDDTIIKQRFTFYADHEIAILTPALEYLAMNVIDSLSIFIADKNHLLKTYPLPYIRYLGKVELEDKNYHRLPYDHLPDNVKNTLKEVYQKYRIELIGK